MSCLKHKQRKRKDCPDCFPVTLKESVSVVAVGKKLAEKGVTKAKNIPLVESNPHLADPEKRKKMIKQSVVSSSAIEGIYVDDKALEEALEKYATPEEIALESFEKKIQAIADRVFSKLVDKIDSITDLVYEHLALPAGLLTVQSLEKLEKEGWKWAHFYDDTWNKASGLNDPHHHLLIRIKNSKWPAKPDFSKQLKENKKEKGKKNE